MAVSLDIADLRARRRSSEAEAGATHESAPQPAPADGAGCHAGKAVMREAAEAASTESGIA